VQRGPVTYLVATTFEYTDVRLYALHRVRAARMLETPAKRPPDFDLDTYISRGALHFGGERTLRLRARVSEELGRILSETPLSEDMMLRRARAGGYTVSATVPDTWALHMWLLSQGDGIEVTAPKALREQLRSTLEASLAHYGDP
jgi:predicted DNA-binding transcriptional regulator YafY